MFDCQLELFDNDHFIRLRCEALNFCKFVFQPVFKMETVEEDMEIAEVNIRDLFINKLLYIRSCR